MDSEVEKTRQLQLALCHYYNNIGIDCYSKIFITILNETLIGFFGLTKVICQGAMKNSVDHGN